MVKKVKIGIKKTPITLAGLKIIRTFALDN